MKMQAKNVYLIIFRIFALIFNFNYVLIAHESGLTENISYFIYDLVQDELEIILFYFAF